MMPVFLPCMSGYSVSLNKIDGFVIREENGKFHPGVFIGDQVFQLSGPKDSLAEARKAIETLVRTSRSIHVEDITQAMIVAVKRLYADTDFPGPSRKSSPAGAK